MARSNVSDPIRNFKFKVQIIAEGALSQQANQLGTMGFSVVSGISVSNEMITYREGGMNTHMHKMVGQSDYGPVTLSKGLLGHESDLYNWQRFLHSWSGGGDPQGGSVSGNNDYRCDVLVTVHDHPVSAGTYHEPGAVDSNNVDIGDAKFGFKLFNCWPASYSLTDLNAGDSSIMIQQLVLNNEGFQAVFADSAGGSVSPTDVAALG